MRATIALVAPLVTALCAALAQAHQPGSNPIKTMTGGAMHGAPRRRGA